MSDFDFFADGNAPGAYHFFDENLMDEVMSMTALPAAQMSPFQADLDVIDDLTVSFADKKWMFDVLLNDIIPYRYNDHFRLFPEIGFYRTLLYNRPNRDDIWGLVERFHEWISSIAAFSPTQTDEVIEALKLRALFHGWPETLSVPPDSVNQSVNELSVPWEQHLATYSLSTASTPNSVPVNGTRAESQSSSFTDHQHPLLKGGLVVAPAFQYKGIIQNMEQSKEMDDAYECHVKRATGAAPEDDASWPATAVQQQAYVQKLFESITDLSDFFELRKARERLGKIAGTQPELPVPQAAENPRKRRRGHDGQAAGLDRPERPKGMSKTDWALVDDHNTPVDLLEAVIHHRISGVEVELICWRLLRYAMKQQQGFTMRPLWSGSRTVSMWEHFDTFSERWLAICENLQDCKMIIHSLTRADWFCKYAGAPSKERGAKLSNDLLNGRRDIQNQVGRDVIKEKTSRQDWTTSDNFEIRDKAGQLVLKGGHLGDKERRQLAVRSRDGGIS
ncbi:hypothetical protein CORC01_12785 [Colletotrichum orchidophilum]|uniref:Uncharacterized protein n=1 Tax=Colletotrichum orchidophilum TaxID=1209926 RepID=A0A1G4AS43_9PEZI|nr:uncharacterized protein CORC01_12785 [Colletotrichum orchidophilum]OHE91935.1 hypothetical protein CORC01_12785 [Colletotrichum orchidophilum]